MGKRGDFFAIDRRVWGEVCKLGMNPAVGYVVLARFSDRANRRSAASTAAVERYTGISRPKAKAAIAALLDSGLVRRLQGGTRPSYELPSDAELRCAQTSQDDPKQGQERIWIPNELVTGAADETPPVERVRQTQDVMTLRLLIDLYAEHCLGEEGGVSRRHLCWKYRREKITDRAEFRLYAFSSAGRVSVRWNELSEPHRRDELTPAERRRGKGPAVDFLERLSCLHGLGLFEWVPYLVESESPDSELMHPVGLGDSSSIEDRIRRAALDASLRMLGEELYERSSASDAIIPVPRHFANVTMVGIVRLRYRPRTGATARWWQDLNEKGTRWEKRYRDLVARFEERAAS